MFFCDFRYFLAEIEGPEQKSDSETEKDCRCCWKVDILGFPAIYDSPYFAQDLMAQTGVQSQPKTSWRKTPKLAPELELNAQTGTKAGV